MELLFLPGPNTCGGSACDVKSRASIQFHMALLHAGILWYESEPIQSL